MPGSPLLGDEVLGAELLAAPLHVCHGVNVLSCMEFQQFVPSRIGEGCLVPVSGDGCFGGTGQQVAVGVHEAPDSCEGSIRGTGDADCYGRIWRHSAWSDAELLPFCP